MTPDTNPASLPPVDHINSLIAKAATEPQALHAMQFSQAAVNAANAISVMDDVRIRAANANK